ncbi:MAG: FAD:protein FMN transferase [Gemmataceae bacterium]|nr:FAD:protein FMN transferase [Gemmataceae bacterium]
MERRDWLNPLHLAQPICEALSLLMETGQPQSEKDSSFFRFSRRAMATEFEVLLPLACPMAHSLADAALDLVDDLESQLTVYRESSEISHINRTAYANWVHPELSLWKLLEKSQTIARETEYGFDPTTGPLIRLWGFHSGPKRVPSAEEIERVLEKTGIENLDLQAKDFSMRFKQPGMEINLGAIGKGYALDRVGQMIRGRFGWKSFLLQGGRSSILAGDKPVGAERSWRVRICHPWEQEKTLAVLELENRALGISAATYNYFEANGVKYGHVLDAKTGYPCQGVACCAVLAPDCASADALSTAFFVRGVEAAEKYCSKHPGIGVLLLSEPGTGSCQAIGNTGLLN